MDKLYAATPPEQRTRPMVLNRAVLDLRHANATMRAVKELSEYLIKHPAEDEPATNVLGSALDAAARENPQALENATFAAAAKEWQRRDQEMDRSHPGWRHWGAKWLRNDDFRGIETDYKQFRDRLAEQQERTYRAQQRYESLYGPQGSIYRRGSTRVNAPLPVTFLVFGHTCLPSRSTLLSQGGTVVQKARGEDSVAPAAERSLSQTAYAAKADAQAEEKALEEMICHRPRPEFPRTFNPVDAGELTPPPGPAPIRATTAPATQPAAAAAATQPAGATPQAQPDQPRRVLRPGDLYRNAAH
jgi:hypothetical protein